METINETNLSISEFQDNELNAEELEAVAGGDALDDFLNNPFGGFESFGKGLKDNSAEAPSRQDDFWYNLGYGASDLIPG